jgi:hypothetical protein
LFSVAPRLEFIVGFERKKARLFFIFFYLVRPPPNRVFPFSPSGGNCKEKLASNAGLQPQSSSLSKAWQASGQPAKATARFSPPLICWLILCVVV